LADSSGGTQLRERTERKLDHLEQISSSQEAQAQVAILPLSAVHEARYAIQQLREKLGTDEDLYAILEPISRIVGWVEASSYFLDVITQREVVKTMLQTGLMPGNQSK
jgi:hypothetical protein